MKYYIVEDSSFILAVLDSNDAFHKDALYVFSKIQESKEMINIVIPPLVMYEVIVVLRRKGVTSSKIEDTFMKLVNISNVSVIALSEMSAFKHAKHALNSSDPDKALRTNDFLIFSVANELQASILTFDKKLRDRCRELYSDIYYCSSLGGMTDETNDFLNKISDSCKK